jgi:SAM-dependent methyltransferase
VSIEARFHTIPNDLSLPEAAARYTDAVSLEISSEDVMFRGDLTHYLSCGASALNVISAIVQLAGNDAPARVLDFGAGAGRVTRWLHAAYPGAAIEACDVRSVDVAFCRDHLGVGAWQSTVDIEALKAPNTYDLTWAGSVLTHLCADDALRIMRRWLDWTNAGGLVIASFHGRTAIEMAPSGVYDIDAERWADVMRGFEATGYGYVDYPHVRGYGISLTGFAWIARHVQGWSDVRLVALAERVWDGHHDVVAIKKLS